MKYYKDRIISDEQTAIEKLTLLLEQGQFELVSDTPKDGNIKLVYLMNDAVESFIVFEKARVTGSYQKILKTGLNIHYHLKMVNMFW